MHSDSGSNFCHILKMDHYEADEFIDLTSIVSYPTTDPVGLSVSNNKVFILNPGGIEVYDGLMGDLFLC